MSIMVIYVKKNIQRQKQEKREAIKKLMEESLKKNSRSCFSMDSIEKRKSNGLSSVSLISRAAQGQPEIHKDERNEKQKEKKEINKYYTSYSKLSEVKLLTIGIASPLRILQWAEKTLPNGKIYGEVLNANTLHHKTFKPQKGGLFCERIFGPLKDFECACGKIDKSSKQSQSLFMQESSKKEINSPLAFPVPDRTPFSLPETKDEQKVPFLPLIAKEKSCFVSPYGNPGRKFCPDCDVEYTWSVIRRYQLGYIKLCSPVTHIWFLKGTPSYLSLLLDMKKRYLQFVTYCSEILTIEKSSLPIYTISNDLKSNSLLLMPLPAGQQQSEGHKQDQVLQQGQENDQVKKQSKNFKKKPRPTFGQPKGRQGRLDQPLANQREGREDSKISCVAKKGWYFNQKEKTKARDFNSALSSILFLRSFPVLLPYSKEKKEDRKEGERIKKEKSSFEIRHEPAKSFPTVSLAAVPVLLSLVFGTKEQRRAFSFLCKATPSFFPLPLVDQKEDPTKGQGENTKNQWSTNGKASKAGEGTGAKTIKGTGTQREFIDKRMDAKAETEALASRLSSFPSFSFSTETNERQALEQKKEERQEQGVSKGIRKKKQQWIGSRGNMEYDNALLKKLANFKNLSKKIPIDLYILFLLERMVHKSSLTLAIQNTWEYLYKNAFIKAINKAKLICAPALAVPSLVTSYRNERFPLGPLEKQQKELISITSPKMILLGKRVQQKEQNHKQTQTTDLVLKNFKIKYTNHVFQLLENIKYAIVSINCTKKFLQKNRFCWVLGQPSQIEKKISSEIEYYLLKNTMSMHKFLKNFFLNSFILDLYFNIYIKKKTNERINNSSKAKTYTQEKTTVFSLCLRNAMKTKSTTILSVLSTYAKFLRIKSALASSIIEAKKLKKSKIICFPTHSFFPEGERKATPFYPFFQTKGIWKDQPLASSSLWSFVSNTKGEGTGTEQERNRNENEKELGKESKKKGVKMGTENQRKERTAREQATNGRSKPNKKNLYNNVYTLSHRERWDIDKDWQIFTLFTFGTTEYLDSPIYTYKNRLFSDPFSFFPSLEQGVTTYPLTIPSTFGVPLFEKGRDERPKGREEFCFSSAIPEPLADQREGFSFGTEKRGSGKAKKGKIAYSLSNSFYSGAGIVQQLLNEFDFYEIKKLDKQNRLILYQLNKSILKLKKQIQIFVYDKAAQIEFKELCKKRDLLIRRTKLVRKLFRKNSNPASMILTLIPVLPPDLRPIVKMGSQIAASDLNRLYQRVIYRNDRLKKFLKDPATSQSYEMKYAQRLLQEAVDNLLQNGKSGPNSEKDSRGRPLKSLSDMLKGKQGRFRQFLLGKRVDYSGRSVIVVGPQLKLHECGLPLEMAKELYLPFLLKSILNKNYAKTVVGAKTLIKKNASLAHELLREIMQVSPVLLNRAPTLHRLGIQAFVPKLIEGRAILLHPLVCSAFNADFDGDQMAVHVPITVEARAEAWKMMLSRNNILSTATGDPLAIPSQDMVLGCYYLTTLSNRFKPLVFTQGENTKGKFLRGSMGPIGMYFNSLFDVIKIYEQRLIDVHSLVWVKWINSIENGTDQEDPLEIRLSSFGQWQEITSNYHRIYDCHNNLMTQYICTTPGRILLNLIIQKITIH